MVKCNLWLVRSSQVVVEVMAAAPALSSFDSLRGMHQKLDGFYARGYLSTWCESVRPEWTLFLHEVFTKDIPKLLPSNHLKDPDQLNDDASVGVTLKKVVDLGCGPSISNIISASAWSPHIVMCDVLTSNLTEIAKFRSASEDAFSWQHYFAFLSTLESSTSKEEERERNENCNPLDTKVGPLLSPEDLEERTREAIQEICLCDISQPWCGLPERLVQSPGDLFEVGVASLVLDVVSTSEEMFRSALENVKGILKPHCGLLIIQGSLGESVYTVGSALFPVMNIDEQKLRQLFAEVGFAIVKWQICQAQSQHYFGLLKVMPGTSQLS